MARKWHANLFALSVCNPQYHLTNLCQQFLHRWHRCQFLLVNSVINYFVLFLFHDPLLKQKFNEKFIFFTKCHCLLLFAQKNTKVTSCQYSRHSCLYLYLKKWHFFKIWFLHLRFILLPDFVYSFQINWKMLSLIHIWRCRRRG